MDAEGRIVSPLGCFKQIVQSDVKQKSSRSSSPAPIIPRPLESLNVSPVSSQLTSPLSLERPASPVSSQVASQQAREIKMATAHAVEELINKLSVKVTTDIDIKLLVDTIYKRDTLLAQQDQALKTANLINKKLEVKVTILTKSEDKMASLMMEQRKLITSSLSLNSREKRLKLVSRHSVTFLSTKPDTLGMKVRDCLAQVSPSGLLPETASDNLNQMEVTQSEISVADEDQKERRDKENEELSRIVGIVDNLSNKYSPRFARYGKYVQTNHSTRRKGRPAIVPKVFSAIWKLLLKPPPPVMKINDPTPHVNLAGINHNLRKNLPKPSYYPLQSVSQNAEMYNSTTYRDHMQRTMVKPAAFVENDQPFGCFHGLKTDQGIIAMPSQIVHGFVWSQEEHDWVIAATMENVKKRD